MVTIEFKTRYGLRRCSRSLKGKAGQVEKGRTGRRTISFTLSGKVDTPKQFHV